MPGRPEQREAYLVGAVEHVLAHGVGGFSLRPLAAALGTSDRMLLYYFGTREELLVTILDRVGDGLLTGLAAVAPARRVAPKELLAVLWSVARQAEVRPVLRLYVEILGQAAAGTAPFDAIAAGVAARWWAWAEELVDVPAAGRRDAAAALLATLDGLLLLDLAVGADAADSAARHLLAD